MSLLQTLAGSSFVKSFVLGQARNASAVAGGWLVSHGLAAGYTTDQITGALCCLAAIAFQAADTFVVKGKIETALLTPPPSNPEIAR